MGVKTNKGCSILYKSATHAGALSGVGHRAKLSRLLSSTSCFHLSLPWDLAQKPCLRAQVVFSNRWHTAQVALRRLPWHCLKEIRLPYDKGTLMKGGEAEHQELAEEGL